MNKRTTPPESAAALWLSSDEFNLLTAYRDEGDESRKRLLAMAQFLRRVQQDFQWEQEQQAQRLAATEQTGGKHA